VVGDSEELARTRGERGVRDLATIVSCAAAPARSGDFRPDPSDPPAEARVKCLDGLRGLMTIFVVVSHYFGEVPHGVVAVTFGWIAVDMFFVLSGYLVGKLILEKQHNDNFFAVFYVRRACRTLPIYAVCVAVSAVAIRMVAAPWIDADVQFPLWSYLSFTQNIFMVTTDSVGAHWLSPTWTLAVEEHFYLLVPAVFFLVPRRRIASVLIGCALAAVAGRALLCGLSPYCVVPASVLLPGRADVLILGLLAALAIKTEGVQWARIDSALPWAPVAALVVIGSLLLADGDAGHGFTVFGPLLCAIGCAAFLLSLVRGAPEARRFHSKVLCFFGTTSYAVYLTHLPILGLMHGMLLGTRPDLATRPQWIVTVAAIPVCVLAGWILTVLVERPLTDYGRTWKWSGRTRGAGDAASG
jgi:peptidoglycan/LPS O-acetylase OafA/YrhL